nr:rhodanese-like domain-containing protein [Rhodoferax sp.]
MIHKETMKYGLVHWNVTISHCMRIGLVAVSALLLISLIVNVWQAWQHMEQQTRRLQTNLLRAPPPSHRIRQEFSIGRTSFNDWLSANTETTQKFNLIDVREPEEFELGHIPSAQNSRYADLLGPNRTLLRRDIPNVLVCDSGWRSGEICTELNRLGYPCRFLDGGYAKWTLEGRSMASMREGKGPGLQSLPHYDQEAVLLDTPDVAALVHNQNAQLIDVRPADEFTQSHLPGAINIPMREALTTDINIAIQRLSPGPLIAVCYDSRSCFYSKVFGLRVSRMGVLYAGRYTVPGEYPIPASLNQSQVARRVGTLVDQVTFWASKPALWVLKTVLNYTHSLLYSIVVLALLLRLIFALPTYWADRDRRLGSRGHTVRNFLLALFQLLVMAVSIDVVANAAGLGNAGTTANAVIDWTEMATPRWALGLLVAILMVYLVPHVKLRSPGRWLVIALIAACVGYALDTVSQGVMVYLYCLLAALLVQQWFTGWWLRCCDRNCRTFARHLYFWQRYF